jgi:hypothetical protein
MNWLDALLDRGREAKADSPPLPKRVIAEQPAKPEVQVTWAQTSYADLEAGDPGAVIVIHYTVQGNTVTLTDEKGLPTAHKGTIRSGETAIQIAKRIALANWSATSEPFSRPLKYRPLGIA